MSVSDVSRHNARQIVFEKYDEVGYNYRMTDLQGAVGLVQLRKLDAFIDERAQWARWYRDALEGIPWLRLPDEPRGGRHGWQAFVTYVDPQRAPAPRNDIMQRLEQLGVATRPGTHAVHMLAYYRERFGLRSADFPAARDCAEQTMTIPLHNRMSAEDYEYVVGCLRQLG